MNRPIPAEFSERDCEDCGAFIDNDGHAHCAQCGMRYPLRRLKAYRRLHLGQRPLLGAIAGAVNGAGFGALAVLLQALPFDVFGLPFPVIAGGIGGALAGFAFSRKTKSSLATGIGAACGIAASLIAGASWWMAVPIGLLAGAVAGFTWMWQELRIDHAKVRRNHQAAIERMEKRLLDVQAKRSHFEQLKRKLSGKGLETEQTGLETIDEALQALSRGEASTEYSITLTELEGTRNHLFRLAENAHKITDANSQDFEIAVALATRLYRELRIKFDRRQAIEPKQRQALLAQIERDETHLAQLHALVIRKEIARASESISALSTDLANSEILAPISLEDSDLGPVVPPVDLFSDELDNQLARLRAEHRVEGWEDESDLWDEPFE